LIHFYKRVLKIQNVSHSLKLGTVNGPVPVTTFD